MTSEDFKIQLLPAKNKLFNVGMRLLNNRQEAEDVVQEVYLKLWKMREKLHQYSSVEALMVTITRNLCLDILKNKSNKFSSITYDLAQKSNNDPEQQIESADIITKIKGAISLLPEQQRTIIQLRDIEGYNYNEIIEMTGFELNYIRVNLSRARKKIRETIQKVQYYEIER